MKDDIKKLYTKNPKFAIQIAKILGYRIIKKNNINKLIAELLSKKKYYLLKKIIGIAAKGYAKIGTGKNALYINTLSSKSGVSFVIIKSFNTYFVLSVKRHYSFDITFIANTYDNYNKDALKTIRALASIAKQHNILKYFKENLSQKEFTKLLLTKESFSLDKFIEWFPDLKKVEEKEEEKVYDFNVVFDDSIKDIDRGKIYRFIKKASSYIKKFGLSKILYGKVFIVDKLPGSYVAIYHYNNDMIKISRRAAKKYDNIMGRNFIHELGHRLWRKGYINKNKVNDMYKQIKYGMFRESVEEGDIFKDRKGNKIEVVEKKEKGNFTWFKVRINDSKSLQDKGIGAFKYMEKVKGKENVDTEEWIPSDYSIKKNEEEWFCEIFAFGLIDNNKMYKDFIKKVIK